MFVPFSALWLLGFALQNFITWSIFPLILLAQIFILISNKVEILKSYFLVSQLNIHGAVISCHKWSNDNFVTLIIGYFIIKPAVSNPHLQGRQQWLAKPGQPSWALGHKRAQKQRQALKIICCGGLWRSSCPGHQQHCYQPSSWIRLPLEALWFDCGFHSQWWGFSIDMCWLGSTLLDTAHQLMWQGLASSLQHSYPMEGMSFTNHALAFRWWGLKILTWHCQKHQYKGPTGAKKTPTRQH